MELGNIIVIKNHMQAQDVLNIIQRFAGNWSNGAILNGEDGNGLSFINPDADVGLR